MSTCFLLHLHLQKQNRIYINFIAMHDQEYTCNMHFSFSNVSPCIFTHVHDIH